MSEINQEQRAYKMLKKAGRHGVKNYQFSANRILRYGSVIKRLREDGYDILVEREYLPNGRATNVYTYTLIGETHEKTTA